MAENRQYPEALLSLMAYFSHLPGIGRRTAERLSLAVMKWKPEDVQGMGELLSSLHSRVGSCPVCGNFTEAGHSCSICSDEGRQRDIICVVEQVAQIQTIERSGSFRGLYHVLGGKLSPMNGIGPGELTLAALAHRLEDSPVREILLAISPDVEGEATAHYIAREFARPGLTITRIASGVPIGADLAFADSATVATAISGRRELKQ